MALQVIISRFPDLRKRSGADEFAVTEPQEERKTMAVVQPRPRRVKALDAGPFAPEIGSFRLHLAAEGKAPKTVRTYVEAVAWFAAAHLIERTSCTRWEGRQGAGGQDRPRSRRCAGPVYAGTVPARSGVAARAVAGDEQPGADDSERDLPDDQPPRPAGRDRCVDAPVPASLQPYLAGPRRQRRGPDGAEWLVLSADAAPLWR